MTQKPPELNGNTAAELPSLELDLGLTRAATRLCEKA